jgi:hypothetical protein
MVLPSDMEQPKENEISSMLEESQTTYFSVEAMRVVARIQEYSRSPSFSRLATMRIVLSASVASSNLFWILDDVTRATQVIHQLFGRSLLEEVFLSFSHTRHIVIF